jgi:hypothetical protein
MWQNRDFWPTHVGSYDPWQAGRYNFFRCGRNGPARHIVASKKSAHLLVPLDNPSTAKEAAAETAASLNSAPNQS